MATNMVIIHCAFCGITVQKANIVHDSFCSEWCFDRELTWAMRADRDYGNDVYYSEDDDE